MAQSQSRQNLPLEKVGLRPSDLGHGLGISGKGVEQVNRQHACCMSTTTCLGFDLAAGESAACFGLDSSGCS